MPSATPQYTMRNHLYTLSIILIFVIYKLQFLNLPYYWDEAWPYAVGVRTMHAKGLSLLPGAIDPELSRGHPLMFHFLGAAWMKIFGVSLLSGHSFALALTVTTALTSYQLCKKLLSATAGIAVLLLLLVQPAIIFQGAFLMPEIMVAMWTMISFYFYFSKKWGLYIVSATALMLTKEPGLILPISIAGCETMEFFLTNEKKVGVLTRKLGIIIAPVFIASVFFILQRVIAGWFFLPLYTNMLRSPISVLKTQLPDVLAYVFVYQGRNGLLLLTATGLIYLLLKKMRIPREHKRICLYLFSFVCCFCLFSAANYYIPRYVACVYPPLIIVCTYILHTAFSKWNLIYISIIAGLAITSVYYYTTEPTSGDCDYSPSIKVASLVVRYCEDHQLNDQPIYATCVLRYDLGLPYVGFLRGKPFSKLQTSIDNSTAYCVFSSDENGDDEIARASATQHLQLMYKATIDKRWCAVYMVQH